MRLWLLGISRKKYQPFQGKAKEPLKSPVFNSIITMADAQDPSAPLSTNVKSVEATIVKKVSQTSEYSDIHGSDKKKRVQIYVTAKIFESRSPFCKQLKGVIFQ